MRFALFLVFMATLAAPATASPPSPTKSEFFISTGAGFLVERGAGFYCAMNYAVRKPLPGTLFGVALFDNPEDAQAPIRVETTIEAGSKDLQLRSPPDRDNYERQALQRSTVTLHGRRPSHLLSTHSQAVLFELPRELVSQFSAEFGVTVR